MSVEKNTASCKSEPGTVVPIVDFNRCEAQADCVRVCPYNVFEIRTISADDKAGLSSKGKLKTWVHGSKKAYTPNASDCRACSLCVTACPENAITLKRVIDPV